MTSEAKENVLCSVRSGCSTVLMTGSDAVKDDRLEAGAEAANAAAARITAIASALGRNLLVLGMIALLSEDSQSLRENFNSNSQIGNHFFYIL